MDGTLIKTKSGLVFPKDCNDWQLLYPDVPGKLKQHHANGYKIVIFTNQAGLSTGKFKISDFKIKIEKIVQKIGVPIQVRYNCNNQIFIYFKLQYSHLKSIMCLLILLFLLGFYRCRTKHL